MKIFLNDSKANKTCPRFLMVTHVRNDSFQYFQIRFVKAEDTRIAKIDWTWVQMFQ